MTRQKARLALIAAGPIALAVGALIIGSNGPGAGSRAPQAGSIPSGGAVDVSSVLGTDVAVSAVVAAIDAADGMAGRETPAMQSSPSLPMAVDGDLPIQSRALRVAATPADGEAAGLATLTPDAGSVTPTDAEAEIAGDAALRTLEVVAASVADSLLETPYRQGTERRVVEVRSGDTLLALLTREAVSRADAHAAVAALEDVYDPRRLQIGQQITLTFDHLGRDSVFLGLELMPDVETFASVERTEEGGYSAGEVENALETRRVAAAGVISSSLAGDTDAAGVPYQVLYSLVRAYSYDVDFQRDLHTGDAFEILFEEDYHASGEFARHGAAVYANLVLSGEERRIYRFESSDGTVDYYTADGQSVRKALLRTPVDSLRMSSGFGMRRHPILGYTRMHRGIDFAGPTGTPILAAGDGVIDFLGTNAGYGRYIRIRHNNRIQTAYAHMSGYGRGLTVGSRVQQGQVIGYIGSTGLSTGPHLHYEVIVAGQQTNPLTVDMPTGRTLEGGELAAFRERIAEYEAEFRRQIEQRQVAEMPERR
ncbi:MAG: peptidoglycan DD-metalloendopeptidase family protein [Rhodospirillaceae bacterium]|nr:peptidoglycan DD-metalloendopeptidase family protein [Rhodospirillaceae bacterium]